MTLVCDVSTCGRPAVVLVHFKHHSRPWPYCAWHGLRNGSARNRFGRWVGKVWITAVRHEQQVSTNNPRGTS